MTLTTRALGSTGLTPTEVGLGGCGIRNRNAIEQATAVIHRALDLGVNFIDTAPTYGNSQAILGPALQGRPEAYTLASKCGRWDPQTGPFRDVDALKAQFEESLTDLQRDRVDILYIHEADWRAWWDDGPTPRETLYIATEDRYDYDGAPVVEFLHWAKDQGLTSHIGISGNNAHLLAKVLGEANFGIDVVLIAFQYSLIWRNAPEFLLPLAKEKGVGVVVGTPFQHGRLAVINEPYLTDPPAWMDEDIRDRFSRLYEISRETGISIAELGLHFLLNDADIDCVITGARTVAEMEANVQCSASGPLSAELQQRLAALGKVFPGHYV